MNRITRFLIMAGMAIAPALAADVAIIANSATPFSEISSADLKQVFLGARSSLEGVTVEPVLAEEGESHEEFLKTYVGKSDSALRNIFKSLAFTGKASMPKSFKSDAAIVQYVAKTKGAIAYVAPSAVGPGVKKLQVK
jgi:ABC-type phosphate transport system substrate-binding protein